MSTTAAIETSAVQHHYGDRQALAGIDLRVELGEIFALVGPNGGGKTTLFRLLSTLVPLQRGSASVLGYDLARQVAQIRREIGVVFQAPSLDKKLTVRENLRYHGRLYGLGGPSLAARESELLAAVGLSDRAGERVEKLSGGLRRRVELAKSMLSRPRLLLMDEPSTGLDPGARGDLWRYLEHLRTTEGTTIVLTTHLLEEADRADRVAILHQGQLVAIGSPDELRRQVGGDSVTIECADAAGLAGRVERELGLSPLVIDGSVRLQSPEAQQLIPWLVDACGGQMRSVKLGRPSLEDVFIARTGHRYWGADEPERE